MFKFNCCKNCANSSTNGNAYFTHVTWAWHHVTWAWHHVLIYLTCITIATAAGSSSSSKMRLRELYRIIDDNQHAWLKRRRLIGDFSDEDCGKCGTGRMKLVKDSSYGKDGHCWRQGWNKYSIFSNILYYSFDIIKCKCLELLFEASLEKPHPS